MKQQTQTNPLQNKKSYNANIQTNNFAAYFILPNRTQTHLPP